MTDIQVGDTIANTFGVEATVGSIDPYGLLISADGNWLGYASDGWSVKNG